MTLSNPTQERWWSSCVKTLEHLRVQHTVVGNSVTQTCGTLTFDDEGLRDWEGNLLQYDTPEAAMALSSFITT